MSGRFDHAAPLPSPGQPTERAVRWLRGWLASAVRLLYRPQLNGWEHLPAGRPYLLIANHSAGLGAAELASFAALWAGRPGPLRPLAGFAHAMGFAVWPMNWLNHQLGNVPSTFAAGKAALEQGVPLLVFPGGDHETLRPVWQWQRVDFAGRTGFLRLAREANVAIVPMGIAGGALTAPMLYRANWLAKALILPHLIGLKRFGISLLAAVGAVGIVAWLWPSWWLLPALLLWLTSPLTFVPWLPASLRYRIGVPIEPEVLFAGPHDDAQLRAALDQVQGAVQALVLQR